MNGIDISGWQPDINIPEVDADFVIIKATEGNSFVNSSFVKQVEATLKSGKLCGVYHYINGAGAAAEMRHFYNTIKPYLGRVIVCEDWEPGGNAKWGDTAYLKACIDEIKKLTGLDIVVYSSKSYFPWDICKQTNSLAWVAQYANNNPTNYQEHPWLEGSYECFIRQYTSTGRIKGYGGNLDLDKCYGTREQWNQLAGSKIPTIEGGNTDMWCIFQPNEEAYLVFCDGSACHPLHHPDQVTAISTVYKQVTGKDIPIFKLGTKDAPWATRFMDSFEG